MDNNKTEQERVLHATGESATAQTLHQEGVLTLHEERAQVDITRVQRGAVTFLKRVIEEQQMIPVTLKRELLEITTSADFSADHGLLAQLDGEALEAGRTYQVVISEERAVVTREVYPVQQVHVRKQVTEEQHSETVTLRREVLDISGNTELTREAGAVALPSAPTPRQGS